MMRPHFPVHSNLTHECLCHLFIENLPLAAAIVDRNLNYLLFSQRWLSELGLEQQDIIGRSHAEVFPQNSESLQAALQHCLSEAIEQVIEESFQRIDGSIGWRRWKIRPWQDETGAIGGVILATEDITERKQAQEALAINEARLREIAANLPGVIFQFTNRNDAWTVDYVSEGIWNLMGVTAEAAMEDIGACIRQIHPDDLESYYASVVKAVEESTPWQYEGRLVKPDGEVRWWQGSSVPTKNQQGETIFCGVMLDITARKEAETALNQAKAELELRIEERTRELQEVVTSLQDEIQDREQVETALRESEAELQAIIDNCPSIIYLKDIEGRIIRVNRQFKTQLNKTTEELKGKTPHELLPKEVADRHLENDRKVFAEGKPILEEEIAPHDDGLHTYLSSKFPIFNAEGVPYAIGGISTDISDRKALETQLAVQKARFDAFFTAANAGMVIFDREFRYIHINEALAEMNGVPVADHINRSLKEVIPNVAPILEPMFQEILDTGKPILDYELVGETPKQPGVTRYWFASYYPLLDQHGEAFGIGGVVIEISDRKRAEQQLCKERDFNQKLIQNSPAFFVAIGADGTVIMMNDSMLRAMGYTADEVVGKDYLSHFVPECDRAFLAEGLKQLTETGYLDTTENHILTKWGEQLLAEWRGTPIYKEDGSLDYFFGVGIDITERKQTEAALQRKTSELEAIFQTLPDLYLRLDLDGTILDYQASAVQKFYFPPERFLGKRMPSLLPPKVGQKFRRAIAQTQQTKSLVTLEYELSMSDGHNSYEARLLPLGNDQIIAIVREISDRKQTEESLRKHNALLHSILESTPDFIVVKDRQGRHVALNSNLANFFGLPIEDIIGKDDRELLPPDDARAMMAKDREVIKTGIAQTYEEEVSDGSCTRTYLTTKAPWRDTNGNILGIVAVARDISDRKRAELALQESQQFIQSIADSSPNILYIFDIIEQRNVYINRDMAVTLGYTAEQIQAMGSNLFATLIHPDDLPAVIRHQDVIKAAANGEVVEVEYRMRHANGEWRWLYSRETVFKRDEDGNVIQYIGNAQDISDRKRAEAALRQSEEQLQAILDNSPAVIYLKDLEGRLLLINRAFEKIMQCDRQQVIGKFDRELLPAEAVAEYTAQDRAVLAAGQAMHWEDTFLHEDGLHSYWTVKFLLRDADGLPFAICGMSTDITARKQAEEALQRSESQLREKATQLEQTLRELQQTQAQLVQTEKMSSLGQLVAGVAHEINNPVNFIYGNLTHANEYMQDLLRLIELYQQHYPNPHPEIEEEAEAIDLDFLIEDLPKLLSSMRVGAERIQKIVLALRNFSRMDEAEVKEIDIHEGIDSTLMILHNRLKDKSDRRGIEIIKKYGTLPLVECYAGQLNQVFMNVLSNAIDALDERDSQRTPEDIKENPSRITIRSQVLNPQQVQIRIADNGPGMTETVRKRLFEPFFTTKAVGKGTGLGLSISYQVVVEKHGGQLECISSPGNGAEFLITLPLVAKPKNNS